LRQELEAVELWLLNAPEQVLQELEAAYPGVYLIHNDAPRPLTALDELRDSFDWAAWKAEGVRVWVVGPTADGYLNVGVEDDLETAQKKLDAAYGDNAIRVSQAGLISALSARLNVDGSQSTPDPLAWASVLSPERQRDGLLTPRETGCGQTGALR
jgi:hypothetical protein